MIHLTPRDDGFRIEFQGSTILEHSKKKPCMTILTLAPPHISQGKAMHPHRTTLESRHAGEWKTIERHPEFVELELKGIGRLALRARGNVLTVFLSGTAPGANALRLRLPAIPGERVYGGGERFSGVDIKGKRICLDPRMHGRSRDAAKADAHSRASLLIDGRRLMTLSCGGPVFFDLRNKRRTVVESWGIPEEIRVHVAPSLPVLLGSARPRETAPAPHWEFDGLCLGVSGGAAEVSKRSHAALDAGLAIGSVYLEDWQGASNGKRWQAHAWLPDERLYPSIEDECARYAKAGIRVIVPFDPLLSRESPLHHEGERFLLPRDKVSSIPDLWNPEARSWIKAVIRERLLRNGFSGWTSDPCWGPQPELALGAGAAALEGGNRFVELWSQVNREAIREAGREGMTGFYSRPGWGDTGSFADGVFSTRGEKTGDAEEVIARGLFIGLCGGGSWHADIIPRGLRKEAGREAFMRSVEAAALSPVFRLRDGEPYWLDRGIMRHLARMSRFWAALKPYHKAVSDEYRNAGLPPLRHPATHYPAEPLAPTRAGRCLYGRDLLAAPLAKPGSDLLDLTLPEDRWVHLWSSREFRGGDITIEAPLGSPAVFFRADSPWAPLFDSLRRSLTRFEDPLA